MTPNLLLGLTSQQSATLQASCSLLNLQYMYHILQKEEVGQALEGHLDLHLLAFITKKETTPMQVFAFNERFLAKYLEALQALP